MLRRCTTSTTSPRAARARDHWPSASSRSASASACCGCCSRASMSRACGASRARRRSPWLVGGARALPGRWSWPAPGAGGCCCARSTCDFAFGLLTSVVPRRDVLQQLPAQQHRRRRRPHHRHGAGRRIEDAGDDGRADRSRPRPARPGAGGGDRRHGWRGGSMARRRARRRRHAVGRVRPRRRWSRRRRC